MCEMKDGYVLLCEAFFCEAFLVWSFYYEEDEVCARERGCIGNFIWHKQN